MDGVKDAGFCHDAKPGGVNLLWTCVESCDTHRHTHQLLLEELLWTLTIVKGFFRKRFYCPGHGGIFTFYFRLRKKTDI